MRRLTARGIPSILGNGKGTTGGPSVVSGSAGNEVIVKGRADSDVISGGGAMLPVTVGNTLGVKLYRVLPAAVMLRLTGHK